MLAYSKQKATFFTAHVIQMALVLTPACQTITSAPLGAAREADHDVGAQPVAAAASYLFDLICSGPLAQTLELQSAALESEANPHIPSHPRPVLFPASTSSENDSISADDDPADRSQQQTAYREASLEGTHDKHTI
jgi:hypothetical protein